MKKTFLNLLFCVLLSPVLAQPVVTVTTENPDESIQNGIARAEVDGAVGNVTYYWSNPNTPLSSSQCSGLDEGCPVKLIVTDETGSAEFEVVVPAISFPEKMNAIFKPIVDAIGTVMYWDPLAALGIRSGEIYDDNGNKVLHPNGDPVVKPVRFIVIWLIFGAIYFTIYMRFINLRGFRHSIELVRGKFSKSSNPGEVSPFQALATALSGTLGLGNISGVAIAMAIGGPGATFWMIIAGFLGMSSKFVECTLGVKYRKINDLNEVSGGPMYYLSEGLKKSGLAKLGKILALIFAILCIGGAIGGGNMFQSNQVMAQFSTTIPQLSGYSWLIGLLLAFFAGLVMIGGIKKIATVTDKLVPLMIAIYMIAAFVIIGANIGEIGTAFYSIFHGAFSADAAKGGFVGVMMLGFQRAAFSNEAGIGSASIAHSASKTDKPVSEGIVALLEPFIDTVVVCTITALVLVFTGYAADPQGLTGSQLTNAAFTSQIPWFKWVLLVSILLFAYATILSWGYYGYKSWTYLFGESAISKYSYDLIYLSCTWLGAMVGLGAVMDFSDMMILGMALPNLAGLFLMRKEVRQDLKNYWMEMKLK